MCIPDKVLIVTPFFHHNIGGAETFAEDLAKALSKKYVVHVCTVKLDKNMTFEGRDYKKSFYLLRKIVIPLINMTIKYKYQKVFALGLMSSFLCCILGIKFNAIVFNLFEKSWWIKFILNKADKIFVEGCTGYKNLSKVGIEENKIVIFHHWCDQSKFTWSALRYTKAEQYSDKNLKVLFIGRPIACKGKHIIQECERYTTGIDYEYLENCEYKDLPKHYQMADVVVVPSLYDDSFSRVVVEAASCGCAVIVSNRGSLPEQVKGFGKAIEPTSENFKNILTKLKNNLNSLEDLKLHTFVFAKEHFSEKNSEVFL